MGRGTTINIIQSSNHKRRGIWAKCKGRGWPRNSGNRLEGSRRGRGRRRSLAAPAAKCAEEDSGVGVCNFPTQTGPLGLLPLWTRPGLLVNNGKLDHRRATGTLLGRHNSRKDGYIDFMDLKCMMEKLGAPQTHLGLKEMIAEVDEDFDGRLSFREFLLIFHKAAAGELQEESGLLALARLSEINVSAEGVKGAKNFFEAKVQAMAETSRFEAEIRAEQEDKRRQAEEQKQRRAAFRQLQSAFAN